MFLVREVTQRLTDRLCVKLKTIRSGTDHQRKQINITFLMPSSRCSNCVVWAMPMAAAICRPVILGISHTRYHECDRRCLSVVGNSLHCYRGRLILINLAHRAGIRVGRVFHTPCSKARKFASPFNSIFPSTGSAAAVNSNTSVPPYSATRPRMDQPWCVGSSTQPMRCAPYHVANTLTITKRMFGRLMACKSPQRPWSRLLSLRLYKLWST